MSQQYTNTTGVPLSVAVYLATDHYDYIPGTISATSMLKPIRWRVLPPRIPEGSPDKLIDIVSVVKSRMGSSIHDSIEKAWINDHYRDAMAALNYPPEVINRIVVNPPEGMPLSDDAIPVYMEIRKIREFMGKKITGKFDFAAEGVVEDFKSTSMYTRLFETKTDDYQKQGSIYRWLNPEIITEDFMRVQFFFTDWSPGKVKLDKKLPRHPVECQEIPLLSLDDTEAFMREKLDLFDLYRDTPEPELPLCTDEELWRRQSVWKYFARPGLKRATKNFDDPNAAYAHKAQQGKGYVEEVPGEVVACKYCPTFSVCTQKDKYLADGSLVID